MKPTKETARTPVNLAWPLLLSKRKEGTVVKAYFLTRKRSDREITQKKKKEGLLDCILLKLRGGFTADLR
jgi:hypothetical protein